MLSIAFARSTWWVTQGYSCGDAWQDFLHSLEVRGGWAAFECSLTSHADARLPDLGDVGA